MLGIGKNFSLPGAAFNGGFGPLHPQIQVELERSLFTLNIIESLGESHGGARLAQAGGPRERELAEWARVGRKALISEFRDLFRKGEFSTLGGAILHIEKLRDQEARDFPQRGNPERPKTGFVRGSSNPWYYQNLFTIAHGDPFMQRALKLDFSDCSGGMIGMAQWARRQQSYGIAEVVLGFVADKAPQASHREAARGHLSNLRGEGWYRISDQTRDLIADIGIEATFMALAGGFLGGLLASGARGLLKWGAETAVRWHRFGNTAGLAKFLVNPLLNEGISWIAKNQGYTLAQYGVAYLLKQTPAGSYLKNSLNNLLLLGSMPLGGLAGTLSSRVLPNFLPWARNTLVKGIEIGGQVQAMLLAQSLGQALGLAEPVLRQKNYVGEFLTQFRTLGSWEIGLLLAGYAQSRLLKGKTGAPPPLAESGPKPAPPPKPVEPALPSHERQTVRERFPKDWPPSSNPRPKEGAAMLPVSSRIYRGIPLASLRQGDFILESAERAIPCPFKNQFYQRVDMALLSPGAPGQLILTRTGEFPEYRMNYFGLKKIKVRTVYGETKTLPTTQVGSPHQRLLGEGDQILVGEKTWTLLSPASAAERALRQELWKRDLLAEHGTLQLLREEIGWYVALLRKIQNPERKREYLQKIKDYQEILQEGKETFRRTRMAAPNGGMP